MALISGSGDETAKVAGATGIQFPKLTTTERNALSSVVEGTIIYNDTENRLEFYNDAGNWVEVNKTPLTATGGSTVLASGKKIHVFTSPGTFAVSKELLLLRFQLLLVVVLVEVVDTVEAVDREPYVLQILNQ